MFLEKLEILKKENLLRYITDRDSAQGPEIVISGKKYINFASNDYLGLAGHPYIREKAKNAIDFYGFGAGASRLLGGGCALHKKLEQRTALFKCTEASLVFNSGYAANAGILPSIADKDFTIFSDEFNHASIIDGCRLSGAKLYIYRHKDLSHLGELINKGSSGKKLVITDTVFSMDGDIAPLKGIYEICRNNGALLYIDDAHGTGVLGNGEGSPFPFSDPARALDYPDGHILKGPRLLRRLCCGQFRRYTMDIEYGPKFCIFNRPSSLYCCRIVSGTGTC